MCRKITFASVLVQEERPLLKITPAPRINILWGENAEEVFWSIAGILDIYPKEGPLRNTAPIQAEICWPKGMIYGLSGEERDGKLSICVNYIKTPAHATGNKGSLTKQFHKRRFRDTRDKHCVFDGLQLDKTLPMGESDFLLDAFYAFLRSIPMQHNGRPLFVINFLERLDESIDLRPIFSALAAAGRQVFIAVPHYYQIKTSEEMPYDTAIHTL